MKVQPINQKNIPKDKKTKESEAAAAEGDKQIQPPMICEPPETVGGPPGGLDAEPDQSPRKIHSSRFGNPPGFQPIL